jgi:two-component system, LytTR family, response regulator
MLQAILIDDEPKNNRILKGMLEQFCPQVQVIGQASNVATAMPLLQQHAPDLIFLDIRMPGQDGFALLDALPAATFDVIFVTAFDHYALKAIRYCALDYLLKPINITILQQAVKRAEAKQQLKNTRVQLEHLLANLQKPAAQQKLALPSKEGLQFITVSDILRLESNKGYTFFHLRNGHKILSARNISEYEALLPMDIFFRAHHSHLVNLHGIKKYHRGRGGYLEMEDGSTVELAIRRKEAFLQRFKAG